MKPRLTNSEIDRLLPGTRIGGTGRRAPSLAAARAYLAGRCRTVQQAADLHHSTRQATARVVEQLLRLAAEDAKRAECVQVGVLIPEESLGDLTAWVDDHGGEVVL